MDSGRAMSNAMPDPQIHPETLPDRHNPFIQNAPIVAHTP
jgi:hypothetical protein